MNILDGLPEPEGLHSEGGSDGPYFPRPLGSRAMTDTDRGELLRQLRVKGAITVCWGWDFSLQTFLLHPTVEALREAEYVRLCPRSYAPVIVVDVDRPYGEVAEAVERLSSRPSLVGINSGYRRPGHRGRCQLVWYLQHPVNSDHPEAVRFLRAVREGLGRAVGGDVHFSHGLSRSPFRVGGEYDWWILDHDGYELRDLKDACIAADSWCEDVERGGGRGWRGGSPEDLLGRFPIDEEGLLMRRQGMFETFRHLGYHIRGCGEQVRGEILLHAMEEVNRVIAQCDPRGALPSSVLVSTARSIAKYCNDHSRWPSGGCSGGRARYVHVPEEVRWEWCSRGGRVRQAMASAVRQRIAALKSALEARRLAAQADYRVILGLLAEGWTYRRITAEHGWSSGKISRAVRWGGPQATESLERHAGATPDIELSDESAQPAGSRVRRHPRPISTARSARRAVLRAFGLSDPSAPRASAAQRG